jgi:hypothetical protein
MKRAVLLAGQMTGRRRFAEPGSDSLKKTS